MITVIDSTIEPSPVTLGTLTMGSCFKRVADSQHYVIQVIAAMTDPQPVLCLETAVGSYMPLSEPVRPRTCTATLAAP